MSVWSFISGVIVVNPRGRTQPEKEYILKTTLEHLPVVEGSEGIMHAMVNQVPGFSQWQSCDEFLQKSNLRNGFALQNSYAITLDARLRDIEYSEAVHMFMKWLCRLAKRICIESVLVSISCPYIGGGEMVFKNSEYCRSLYDMDSENRWSDYLMWDYNRDEDGCLLGGKPERNSREEDGNDSRR